VSLYDGAQPAISRRALFMRLRPAQAGEDEAPVIDNLLQRGAPLSARLPQQAPISRQRLLAALYGLPANRNGEFATARTAFGAVDVDAQRCSACGLCARFCPTGALQFAQETGQFSLSFRAAACIDCSICIAACPEDALRMEGFISLDLIVRDAVVPCVTGSLGACAICGVATRTDGNVHAAPCHACRQGAGAVTSLCDEAGLMTDLLRRSVNPNP
jgi:ferredoxin